MDAPSILFLFFYNLRGLSCSSHRFVKLNSNLQSSPLYLIMTAPLAALIPVCVWRVCVFECACVYLSVGPKATNSFIFFCPCPTHTYPTVLLPSSLVLERHLVVDAGSVPHMLSVIKIQFSSHVQSVNP